MIDTSVPFVLLDDARIGDAAPARLYTAPVEIAAAYDADGVAQVLDRLRRAAREGLHAAGFLAYEAAPAFDSALAIHGGMTSGLPLAWFGLFQGYREIAADKVPALLPDPASGWAGRPEPRIVRADYEAALERVQAYIAAGDIYQANLTFQCDVQMAGAPLALYAGLRQRACAGHGGVVHTGSDWLLSFSPELFFALHDGRLTTRPMKGTAQRDPDPVRDREAIDALRTDPKQRAENLMIVDLLRNDLSRVAVPGSVRVPALFAIETYPTVHQMTSTVTADLAPEKSAVDVLATIFPCGSITGAPKIRATEIIAEIETGPRGIYTGSIGRVDPSGDAAFNVAIRTMHLAQDGDRASIGLGSGIVADSHGGDEWRECLAKGEFVQSVERPFDLIETMRFDPNDGILRLDRHLARMKQSAETFGFAFDRHEARNELQAATFKLRDNAKVRMLLGRSGALAIEIRPLEDAPDEPVSVAVVPLPIDPSDFRLRHKTSDRAFYAAARAPAGTFEVALRDPRGFLTEGSFTHIFVEYDGKLLTPPLSRGLLPGILRAELIESGRAVEADLTPADLLGGFFVGNAVRGLLPATFVPL